MQIHTKFHRFMELLSTENVYFTGQEGTTSEWYQNVYANLDIIRNDLKELTLLPKFVFDGELLELATKREFCKSLLDMKKAGLLHLPYPTVLVEFKSIDNQSSDTVQHAFVMLNESDAYKLKGDVIGNVYSINKDINGEYLVLSPTMISATLEEREGDPWLQITGSPILGWFTKTDLIDNIVRDTYLKDGKYVALAWFLILLILTTKGVEREVVEPKKLNKIRNKRGKSSIPKHIYLKIGHVYQKDGTAVKYDSRKSPRPHWRRGHIRNTKYGEGRSKVKEVYIHPMLVAYHGEDEVANLFKEYDIGM